MSALYGQIQCLHEAADFVSSNTEIESFTAWHARIMDADDLGALVEQGTSGVSRRSVQIMLDKAPG